MSNLFVGGRGSCRQISLDALSNRTHAEEIVVSGEQKKCRGSDRTYCQRGRTETETVILRPGQPFPLYTLHSLQLQYVPSAPSATASQTNVSLTSACASLSIKRHHCTAATTMTSRVIRVIFALCRLGVLPDAHVRQYQFLVKYGKNYKKLVFSY